VAKPVKAQTGKAPVVYLLDGNSLFGMVADLETSDGDKTE
jgi:predicted alpha/beta superfamily hydrolase